MPSVTAAIECPGGAGSAFDCLADYTNLPALIPGLSSCTPVTVGAAAGLGAQYRAQIKLGPFVMNATIVITAWDRGRILAFESYEGLPVVATFRFKPTSADSTGVSVDAHYRFPRGVSGTAMEPTIGPLIDAALTRTLRNLHNELTRLPRSSS